MSNVFCVWIDGDCIPHGAAYEFVRFSTDKPQKIGDTTIALFSSYSDHGRKLLSERKVILLKSKGHVKDCLFLVDLKHKLAWPYKDEEQV